MSNEMPVIDFGALGAMMDASINASLSAMTEKDLYSDCKASPTAFENWFGTVEALGIRSPASIVIECPKSFSMEILDNRPLSEESRLMLARVSAAVQSMADKTGFPVFVKNGFTSNKQEWKNSCCFTSADSVEVLDKLTSMALFLCNSPLSYAPSIIVREMIKTDAQFYAFDGHMPITQEFRLFARDGKAVAYQPYWSLEAFDDKTLKPTDWQERLAAMKHITSDDLKQLADHAAAVSGNLGGYWSVDFLKDQEGRWWLIDMAEGELSYVNTADYQTLD
ncbi:MAG: hypothetical protein RSG77_21725 [Hafnia sp.]